MNTLYASPLIACILSCFISAVIRKRRWILSVPSDRCSHDVPTPTAGGVAVWGSFLTTLILTSNPLISGSFFLAALILSLTSLWDDWRPLSYRYRLITQGISIACILASGLVLKFPGIPISSGIALAISLFVLMGLINAANFADGLDGLLCGCVLVGGIFIAGMGAFLSPSFLITCLVFWGSIFGFFVFNFPKASLFLGDTGSTFIGMTLGTLALTFQEICPPEYAPFAWIHKGFMSILFPLSFLLFDVTATLIHRAFRGCQLTQPHRDHLFHRLHDIGYTHVQVTLIYVTATWICGFLSFLFFLGTFSFFLCLGLYTIIQISFVFWVVSQISKYGRGQ